MANQAVILLGTDTPIGLALIREFANHNVTVVGLGRTHASIGASSRHLKHFYVRQKDGEQLIEQLRSLAKHHQCDHLLAISEADIVWLNTHRQALMPLSLLVPTQPQMDQVLNKSKTYEISSRLGIKTPPSYEITHLDDLEQYRTHFAFPLVLKWDNPQETIAQLRAHGLSLFKTHYVESYDELVEFLSPYQAINRYPLIQHYCPGQGLGQFFLRHNGKIIQRFQHQRLHEWPPEGGTSTLCQAVSTENHQALLQKSEALLEALNWEGVAMVEYRYDSATQQAYLMEINGRFWGSYPLAQQCGADFGWLLLAYCGLGITPDVNKPTDGLVCRFMFPELRRLARVCFSPSTISDPYYRNTPLRDLSRFIGLFFYPKSRYYVFNLSDSQPLFHDLFQALKKIFLKVRKK